ncbi:MAG TPA: OmpA family protein, partial [Melioribacteraceae bacterium]|nr:OmpA family protein [Melioribacteraceae bacterium]
ELAYTINSLRINFPNYLVEVEGHTDNIPINTPQYPSNWELSTNRATNIVKLFIEEGIPPVRLRAAGYADSRPKLSNVDVNGNSIPQNQAANRRVVIFVQREN